MRGNRRRRLLWSVLVVCLLANGASWTVRAAEPRLDEPGTYLIDVGSGRTIHLGHGAMVDWAPDSKTVAVAETGVESPLPRLQLFPVPDGPAREVKFADKGEINHLRWAPDGSALAFTLT